MGLPLFIAPVESNLPPSSRAKTSPSPSRSAIRRPDSNAHDRRARRHARNAQNYLNAAAAQEVQHAASGRERMQNRLRSGHPRSSWEQVDFTHLPLPPLPSGWANPAAAERYRRSPFREALREMSWTDSPQRGGAGDVEPISLMDLANGPHSTEVRRRFERHVDLITGHLVDAAGPVPANTHWSAPAPGPGAAPGASTVGRREEGVRSSGDFPRRLRPFRHSRIADGRRGQAAQEGADVGSRSASPYTTQRSGRDHDRWAIQWASRGHGGSGGPGRHGGLGDRDRSVSPETWDILLSTLTPDPQPPSASSSFASTAASQNASTSTNTTPPTEPSSQATADAARESGCEHSDDELLGPGFPMLTRARRHGEGLSTAVSRSRRRPRWQTSFHTDGPAESTRAHLRGGAVRGGPRSQELGDGPANPDIGLEGPSTPQGGWVGTLSVGATNHERPEEGDDNDRGMQRIMRGMAMREDIPDEWWAEAGLGPDYPRNGPE